jgi:hypothetical protein
MPKNRERSKRPVQRSWKKSVKRGLKLRKKLKGYAQRRRKLS